MLYTFTRAQLADVLEGAIGLYAESDTNFEYTPEQATASAVTEVFEGLDADREIANDERKEPMLQSTTTDELLVACQSALAEFERLTGDIGFEPERFRERLAIVSELSAAIAAAKGEA